MSSKIVDKLIKVDLHIHSAASIKDKKIVSNNTLSNIDILIKKLNSNKVNMVAITDHNAFDYNLYHRLKKEENKGTIEKVLPGIEFDVELNNERVHIITIFDDSSDDKIKKIAEKIKHPFDNSKHNAYQEKTFKDILQKIELSVLLIAHQKSGIRADNQNENLSRIGEKEFDILIGVDYFDAVEFRSGKVEGILKDYKEEKNLLNLRYITGTDCHVWDVYPQQKLGDTTDIKYSFLKCLPSFKGLVMSLTEPRRITTALSDVRTPFINQLEFEISGKKKIVPLSSGLNVIIGDNSIGKSLILESLINPNFDGLTPTSKKKGYKNFLINNKISIKSFTSNQIKQVKYDKQGGIREVFQSGSKLLDVPFFKNKFSNLDLGIYLKEINSYVEKVLVSIEKNQKKFNVTNNLDFEIELPSEIEDKTYRLRVIDKLVSDSKDYTTIISKLKILLSDLKEIVGLENFNDVKKINRMILETDTLISKYENINIDLIIDTDIRNTIKSISEEFEKKNRSLSEAQDNKVTEFKKNINEAKNRIVEMILEENIEKEDDFSNYKNIEVDSLTNPFGKYNFVTRTKEKVIDKAFLAKILTYPLNQINTLEKLFELNEFEFEKKLKEKFKQEGKDFSTVYRESINAYILENILKKENVILDGKDDISNGNSPGKNATIYMDILANDKSQKIYIVDQPDDDVSHSKINNDLIGILRNMSDNKQILFVTHKPELVVNLDVENIIVIASNEKNEIEIHSGALEYSCENYAILNDVAEILDGGAETIRRRWKRYDKGI